MCSFEGERKGRIADVAKFALQIYEIAFQIDISATELHDEI